GASWVGRTWVGGAPPAPGPGSVPLPPGGSPPVPATAALKEGGSARRETLFALEAPPASFVNIGGGPIAVEMVQGFTRLGIPATLLQKGSRILPKDEPALVDKLVDKLRSEGIDLRVDVETEKVIVENGKKIVHATENGKQATWAADELLVAVGRVPNKDGLGLEELGIECTPTAIVVDDRGRTSVDTVYACGDVAGRHLFTHSAAYEGVRAVRDMFF